MIPNKKILHAPTLQLWQENQEVKFSIYWQIYQSLYYKQHELFCIIYINHTAIPQYLTKITLTYDPEGSAPQVWSTNKSNFSPLHLCFDQERYEIFGCHSFFCYNKLMFSFEVLDHLVFWQYFCYRIFIVFVDLLYPPGGRKTTTYY